MGYSSLAFAGRTSGGLGERTYNSMPTPSPAPAHLFLRAGAGDPNCHGSPWLGVKPISRAPLPTRPGNTFPPEPDSSPRRREEG